MVEASIPYLLHFDRLFQALFGKLLKELDLVTRGNLVSN